MKMIWPLLTNASKTRRIQAGCFAAALALWAAAAVQAAPVARKPSLKKGFDTVVRPDGGWRKQVTALRAHWFYSWGGDEPPDMPPGVSFVPMDWGYYGNKDNGLVHVAGEGQGPAERPRAAGLQRAGRQGPGQPERGRGTGRLAVPDAEPA